MSRLEEAMKRARQGAQEPDTFNVSSPRALDWFSQAESPAPPAPAPGPRPLDAFSSIESGPATTIAAVAPLAPVVPDLIAADAPPIAESPLVSHLHTGHGSKPRYSDRLVIGPEVHQVTLEQYRRVAAVLHHVQRDRGIKIVMVASAIPSEGKTLTAANLALTISESYRRKVLLIDGDLRRPMVHNAFGVPNKDGLVNVLQAMDDQRPNVVNVTPQLSVMPAGGPDPDPLSGLTSDRMRRLLKAASDSYDWVVIDTPPVGVLPDANLLAAMVDVAVLVVGAGQTPVRLIQQAIGALGREKILGVVLNRVDEKHIVGNYAGYGYYGYNNYLKPKEKTL